MKKNEAKKLTDVEGLKKLRLSRETLHTLTRSDNQKVVGGATTEPHVITSPDPGCPDTTCSEA